MGKRTSRNDDNSNKDQCMVKRVSRSSLKNNLKPEHVFNILTSLIV